MGVEREFKEHFDGNYPPEVAAAILNVSEKTLARWRMKGGGPAYRKIGRKITYTQSAIDEFRAKCTRHSTSQAA